MRNAARDLKISKITKEDYERMSRDMEELQEALNRSQSFISTIATAVDPNKLSVRYDMFCCDVMCHDMLRFVLICYDMSCYVMICHVMLCYVVIISYHIISRHAVLDML